MPDVKHDHIVPNPKFRMKRSVDGKFQSYVSFTGLYIQHA